MLPEASDAIPSGKPRGSHSIRQVLLGGIRANHATLFVPLLIFCVIGPAILSNSLLHVTGMLDSRQTARVPELAFAAIEFLSRWAFLGLLIGAAVVLPWIAGGAAGRYADLLDPGDRLQQSFSSHARRSYGTTVVIMLGFGALLTVGSIAQSLIFASNGSQSIVVTTLRMLTINIARTVLATWMWLSVAAVALEDRGVKGAARRAGFFIRSQPQTFAMLIAALMLGHAVSHVIVRVQEMYRVADAPLAYVSTIVVHGAWTAYLMALTLAWAVAFLNEWRLRETARACPLT